MINDLQIGHKYKYKNRPQGEDFIENIDLIGREDDKESLNFPTHDQWRKTFSWMECNIITAIDMLQENLNNLRPVINNETNERMLISSKPNANIAKYG
mgnify:CR=1 FL=1